MPSLEERVAYLEGRVEEHARGVGQLRDAVVHLDERLSTRIDALDQKVDPFRDELAGRIDSLDQKGSRRFIWLAGIQVTVLLAVIGVLLAR